jgi:hypothetical protein
MCNSVTFLTVVVKSKNSNLGSLGFHRKPANKPTTSARDELVVVTMNFIGC